MSVDLVLRSRRVVLPDGEAVEFPIEPFAKHCLLNGIDELGFLLGVQEDVERYEAEHPARVQTAA